MDALAERALEKLRIYGADAVAVRLQRDEATALFDHVQSLQPILDSARIAHERIAPLAADLLGHLRPWDLHGPVVRSLAAQLTMAVASLPVMDSPTRGFHQFTCPRDGCENVTEMADLPLPIETPECPDHKVPMLLSGYRRLS